MKASKRKQSALHTSSMATPVSTGSCSEGRAGRSCVALSDPAQKPQTSLLSPSISGGIPQRLPSFKGGGISSTCQWGRSGCTVLEPHQRPKASLKPCFIKMQLATDREYRLHF